MDKSISDLPPGYVKERVEKMRAENRFSLRDFLTDITLFFSSEGRGCLDSCVDRDCWQRPRLGRKFCSEHGGSR